MLPHFRVRGLRAEDGEASSTNRAMLDPLAAHSDCMVHGADGVIHIEKKRYDDLLAERPAAALRYVDEDDGEVVMVGSSFELDQRLQEPVVSSNLQFAVDAPYSKKENGVTAMHDFDIEKSKEVVNVWRTLEDITIEMETTAHTALPMTKTETSSITLPAPKTIYGSERYASQAGVRFGTPTALSPARLRDMGRGPRYENRWASYGLLPGAFDHPAALPVKKAETSVTPPKMQLEEQKEEPKRQMDSDVTLNKKEPKDLPVHQPLLDMFEVELAKLMSAGTLAVPDSVSGLGHSSKSAGEIKAAPATSAEPNPTEAAAADVLPSVGSITGATCVPTLQHVTHASTPAELLGRSIKSLFDGVGLLAATFNLTNAELHQQIKHAQQDFPNNVEEAARASVTALNSLREVIVRAATAVGGPEVRTEPQETVENVEQEAVQKMTQNETESAPAARIWDLVKICKSCKKLHSGETDDKMSDHCFFCPMKDEEHSSYTGQGLSPSNSGLKPQRSNEVRNAAAGQYEAEKILSRRYITYGHANGPKYTQYLVRWAGHGSEEDVWYDVENLWGCHRLVEEFDLTHVEALDYTPGSRAFAHETATLHNRTAGNRMVPYKAKRQFMAANPKLPDLPEIDYLDSKFSEPHRPKQRRDAEEHLHPNKWSEQVPNNLSEMNRKARDTVGEEKCEAQAAWKRLQTGKGPATDAVASFNLSNDNAGISAAPKRHGSMPHRKNAELVQTLKQKQDGDGMEVHQLGFELTQKTKGDLQEPTQEPGRRQEEAGMQRAKQPVTNCQPDHPATSSCQEPALRPFSFSPADVMTKFPSVSHLECGSLLSPPPSQRAAVSMSGPAGLLIPENAPFDEQPLRPIPGSSHFSRTFKPIPVSDTVPARAKTMKNQAAARHDSMFTPRRVQSMAFRPSPLAGTRIGCPVPSAFGSLGPSQLSSRHSLSNLRNGSNGIPNNIAPMQDQRRMSRMSFPLSQPSRQPSTSERKVASCVTQLLEMGFKKGESEAVAAEVEGDLEKAIDVLEEDRAVWDGRASAQGNGRIPGAWAGW